MRIIERTDLKTHDRVFVVQDENNNALAYNRVSAFISTRQPAFVDVRTFSTLQEAKDFAYQYHNNLAPGERIVS